MNNKTVRRPILQFDSGGWRELEDEVTEEHPLTVRLDGMEFATIVCSSSELTDLVYGFLASEGIIMYADDVLAIDWDDERGFADVTLKRKMTRAEADFGKRVIGSCCGKSRQFYLRADTRTAKTVTARIRVTVDECFALMAALQEASDDFSKTGGIHNAALCALDERHSVQSAGQSRCRIIAVRSDIGRHNALDKLYGHVLRNRLNSSRKMIAFSGRISSEVLLKVSKIGVGVLISKSAPTALALRLADDLGITVIGFARGTRLNVYTHPDRIVRG